MQSTGQTSTHAVSFVPMHGSQMMYATAFIIPKRGREGFFAALIVWVVLSGAPTVSEQKPLPTPFCDPALARLFAPRAALAGRYEVCADPRPLAEIAPPEWTVEALEGLDAFGTAGAYNRGALARLFGGTRARVVRGWTLRGDRFEAVTLVSPHPDATMTRLESETLAIR